MRLIETPLFKQVLITVFLCTSTLINAQEEKVRLVEIELDDRKVQAVEKVLESDSEHVAQRWVEFLAERNDLTGTLEGANEINELSMHSAQVGSKMKDIKDLKLILTAVSSNRTKAQLISKNASVKEFPVQISEMDLAHMNRILWQFETYVETGFYPEDEVPDLDNSGGLEEIKEKVVNESEQ